MFRSIAGGVRVASSVYAENSYTVFFRRAQAVGYFNIAILTASHALHDGNYFLPSSNLY